jgi:hypothetical protein
VLDLLREKGFAIQGVTTPPLTPPAPPRLLSIETPAAISWQGSAGASSYDVLRADGREEAWSTIAQNVSDAAVQYRPLFHDDTAEPGKQYFYKVVARNAAGVSEASNIVGPVTPRCRTLVDECLDLSLVNEHQDDVEARSDNVRRMQEDAHRLVLPPGGAVTYKVASPIRAFRVYTFAESPEEELVVSASSDGKNFDPLQAVRQAFASGQGDYGYLVPLLFQGEALSSNATYLKIAAPDSSSTSEPLQISRVEIDYDGEK